MSTASFAIAGPKGLADAAVARLHDAFKAAVDDAAVRTALVSRELVPRYRPAAEFRRRIEAEIPLEREIVTALGLGRKN